MTLLDVLCSGITKGVHEGKRRRERQRYVLCSDAVFETCTKMVLIDCIALLVMIRLYRDNNTLLLICSNV